MVSGETEPQKLNRKNKTQVGPLTKRLALGGALTVAVLCNKLGFLLVDKTGNWQR